VSNIICIGGISDRSTLHALCLLRKYLDVLYEKLQTEPSVSQEKHSRSSCKNTAIHVATTTDGVICKNGNALQRTSIDLVTFFLVLCNGMIIIEDWLWLLFTTALITTLQIQHVVSTSTCCTLVILP